MVRLYLHSPIRLHGVVLNYAQKQRYFEVDSQALSIYAYHENVWQRTPFRSQLSSPDCKRLIPLRVACVRTASGFSLLYVKQEYLLCWVSLEWLVPSLLDKATDFQPGLISILLHNVSKWRRWTGVASWAAVGQPLCPLLAVRFCSFCSEVRTKITQLGLVLVRKHGELEECRNRECKSPRIPGSDVDVSDQIHTPAPQQ
jgi:hypothetical protein